MRSEKIVSLIKYLKKKGFDKIEEDVNYKVEVYYNHNGIESSIILFTNSEHLTYYTKERLVYKNTGEYVSYYKRASWRSRGCEVSRIVGGDNIRSLRTSYKRKDFNRAVLKNIQKIQVWLEPTLEKKRKKKEELNDYASELEFYFKDKYGNVSLDINDGLFGNIKNISALVKHKDGSTETFTIRYEEGNYFLDNSSKFYNNKTIYKQREKKI